MYDPSNVKPTVTFQHSSSTSDAEEDDSSDSLDEDFITAADRGKKRAEPQPNSRSVSLGGKRQREEDGFRKKKRTAFTSRQLEELEKRFKNQKYLTKADRVRLAEALGLTEKHVKTWYQNRRTKWKRGTTEVEWSKEREISAAVMYRQFVDEKNRLSSPNEPQALTRTVVPLRV